MSLAAIKRRLQVGCKIQMVRHDWGTLDLEYLTRSVPDKLAHVRAVNLVQSNAVRFEGGSWLSFPPAKEIRETANGFQVALTPDFSKLMEYEWR